MSYLNTTIKDLISERIGRNTFLPAIQREYVWSTTQVEKLFDSIMCEYPISSFLFWKIREENKKDWTSYKFISDFDQEHPHNQEANLDGVNQDIYLVLDGQQRITSINIGLRGTYRYFYRKWRKTRLYLNLLWDKGEDNPEEMTYYFLFKEDDSPINADCPQLWYRVGDILNYTDSEDAKEAMESKLKLYDEEQKRKAQKMIGRLFNVINVSQIINYYEEKTPDYDKVLEIFIRTNTGGQKLEYSDILLSTATAKWRNLNAREEINEFTDDINKIGAGYSFGKDFVMKAAMYLTEDLPIKYSLSSFTKKNLECIEDHWEETEESIERSVRLISGFGFTSKNIVATLVLLPVAQYLHYKPAKYMTSSDAEDVQDQLNIQKWIIVMLLKGVFGGSSDSILNRIRPIIKESAGKAFPYKEICTKLGVDPAFNDLEIENYLNTPYCTRYSFLILSLLYPNRDWRDRYYNEDHIFPKAKFTKKNLVERGYDDEKINAYLSKFNTILNLELLEERENKSKNDRSFNEWIKGRDSNFKQRHHIPDMDDYSMDNFLSFIEERKKLLFNCMQKFRLE